MRRRRRRKSHKGPATRKMEKKGKFEAKEGRRKSEQVRETNMNI
jgi:hypothetical protein